MDSEMDPEEEQPECDIGYFAVDNEQPHVMSKQQHTRVKEGTAAVRARDRHLWSQVRPFRHRRSAELPRGCRTFLLEIFAGAAILTQVAYQDWGLPVSNPVDLNTGYDLLTHEGRQAVDLLIEKDDPYAISFAPVCTPWTSWTNLLTGEARNKVMMTRKRWQPVIKWMYGVVEQRLSKGRHVLVENPWNSAMWDTKQSQSFFNKQLTDSATLEPLECVKVDQCSVGLCDTINGLPHLKPTGFLTASYHVKTDLAHCRCPGDHQHQQLDTKLRCQRAQQWPKQLCEIIIGGWVRELEYCYSMAAFPAEAEQEVGDSDEEDTGGNLDAIHEPGDFVTGISAPDITLPDYAEKKEQEQMEIIHEETPHPPPPSPEGHAMQSRQRLWKQLPYTTRVALRRLHNMTGHAPPSAMQRLLRTAGADPDAIRGLDNFRCQVCEEKKKPQRPAATKMPEEYRFNKAISLDVMVVKDAIGRRYKVMSIVDLGTLFHVAVIVGEGAGPPGSGDMAHALSTCWLNWAGIPDSIVLDRGLENRGKLQQLVKAHGILLRYIGVESAYQLGRGERQGGILKEVIKTTVMSRQLRGRQNMEFVVTEAVSIKNHRINHNGFSPAQWVLGRNPPEIDALTNLDSQARLGTHQEILDGESAFAQQMMVRGAARESFAQADSSQRIRASLLRKSVPTRGPYLMGDLVCYYKRQGAHRQWKWYGPARVIGQEGKGTLWIVHGGVPLTVSVEQCRHATGNEMLAKRVMELRPSRKRRREDMEAGAPPEMGGMNDDEEPFIDDLVGVGGPPGNEQPGFFDMRGRDGAEQETHEPHLPPPGLSVAPTAPTVGQQQPTAVPALPPPTETMLQDDGELDTPTNAEQEIREPHLPPPGLSVATTNMPRTAPEGGPEIATGQQSSSSSSVHEPEQEIAPSSRRTSMVTENAPGTTVPTRTMTQLQTAIHRSVDALDGMPRKRSRSPRGLLAAGPTMEFDRGFHGFLARRVNKKSAAARSKELHYHKVPDDVREGIDGARLKEWGNWQGFDAVEIIKPEDIDQFLRDNDGIEITPTRWVDNNKAQPWESPRYKSRIVVRGDLEGGAEGARTDSPTASSMMFNLLLSITANKRWRLRGGDITASFLQGDVITRTLILRPPPGGLPGVPPGSLLRARKPVYGTKDAPRGFWKRLHRVALSKGLRAIPGEHAAYVLQDAQAGLQGLVIAHVDDLLWSGTSAMDAVMDGIIKEFKFGALEFGSKFEYCGRTVEQGELGIAVTCPHNAAKVRPIYVDAARRKQRDHHVTEPERNQLRSVVGSLNWLVRVCRLDIAYEVHRLQAVMQKALVEDLINCNQILNYVKKTPDKGMFFKYEAFDVNDMTIYSITDASHGADYDVGKNGEPLGNRSQSGRILMVGPSSLETTGQGTVHVLEYHSSVIRRVCRSTLQAETLSMVLGYENAEHLRAVLYGLEHGGDRPDLVRAMDARKVVLFTDCKSLEQHLRQPGLHTVGDKRLAIDLSALRQLIWRLPGEDVGDPMLADAPPPTATTTTKWIDTATMIANGLTKRMKSAQIDDLMKNGKAALSFVKLHISGSVPEK